MIVIKMFMCPKGDRSVEKPLGRVEIFNNLSGSLSVGNYGYRCFDRGGRQFRTGDVSGFPRKRLLVFDLLFRVLRHAFGERNAAKEGVNDEQLLPTIG